MSETAQKRHNWRKDRLAIHIALLAARKARGMSQADAARQLLTSRRTFQRWEDDGVEPSASELLAWAGLFGIRVGIIPQEEGANSDAREEA